MAASYAGVDGSSNCSRRSSSSMVSLHSSYTRRGDDLETLSTRFRNVVLTFSTSVRLLFVRCCQVDCRPYVITGSIFALNSFIAVRREILGRCLMSFMALIDAVILSLMCNV